MRLERAVFLDRDGVINKAVVKAGKPYPPANLSALELLPQVAEALHALRQANFLLIVVTNQPDVAKGITPKSVVEEIHHHLQATLPLDAIYACFHEDADNCTCRKPAPGAIFQAAEKYHIHLKQSYMVGDRWRDIEAGQNAGCQTIFIDYGYAEKQPEKVDFRAQSLYDATHFILEKENERN